MKGELSGFAATDQDVAEMVTNLEGIGLFGQPLPFLKYQLYAVGGLDGSGIDADGSVFTMVIRASGVYEQRDTAASTCERLGLGSAPWASYGWADFTLEPIPTAHLTGTTICFDDENQPVVSTNLSDNDWFWAYDAGTDTIIFSADNTALTRVDA